MVPLSDRIGSPAIASAVEVAAGAGNGLMHISEGWTRVRRVVFMANPLTTALRGAIEHAAPSLVYWSAPGSPHNPGTEGFLDEAAAVALSFPTPDRSKRVR
jgi:hypothetical protein